MTVAYRLRRPSVTVIPTDAWLRRDFGYERPYNPAAYTMVADRQLSA